MTDKQGLLEQFIQKGKEEKELYERVKSLHLPGLNSRYSWFRLIWVCPICKADIKEGVNKNASDFHFAYYKCDNCGFQHVYR